MVRKVRMLLHGKSAVVYGGAGAIGSAVARGFAREGATVHLAGRTVPRLEAVAEEIRAAGGKAETAQVDALDEAAIDEHADAVARDAGSLDISFNLLSHGDPAVRAASASNGPSAINDAAVAMVPRRI
jgi:3-oxoacyl-[acyl-carrier protein] reductase